MKWFIVLVRSVVRMITEFYGMLIMKSIDVDFTAYCIDLHNQKPFTVTHSAYYHDYKYVILHVM